MGRRARGGPKGGWKKRSEMTGADSCHSCRQSGVPTPQGRSRCHLCAHGFPVWLSCPDARLGCNYVAITAATCKGVNAELERGDRGQCFAGRCVQRAGSVVKMEANASLSCSCTQRHSSPSTQWTHHRQNVVKNPIVSSWAAPDAATNLLCSSPMVPGRSI